MSKINNLLELKNFVDSLCKNRDPSTLANVHVGFTDRFNEYSIDGVLSSGEDSILIDCNKVGSVLEGTHRVMGGNRE